MKEDEIKKVVKERYSAIARNEQSCCPTSCCGTGRLARAEAVGYPSEELDSIPQEAVLGVGCGNPVALAELQPGEVVLDLGSGAGIDVFLAARRVGSYGRVIGVDMTEDMVDKARRIAEGYGYRNIEFRLGEIESLPVDDNYVDVVISNCVINLSPDKAKVFQEAYRALKPAGRLIVSDIVTEEKLPERIRQDPGAWSHCIAGALEKQEYLEKITGVGFEEVQVISERRGCLEDEAGQPMGELASITVKAYKPKGE